MAHSIKGMSATMGFARLAELTHAMEDVFELLRQRRAGISTRRDRHRCWPASTRCRPRSSRSRLTGTEDLDPAAAGATAAQSGVGPHARAGGRTRRRLRGARSGARSACRRARPARGGDAVRRGADAGGARAHGARRADRARRAARLRARGRRGRAVPRTADRGVAAQRARGGCGRAPSSSTISDVRGDRGRRGRHDAAACTPAIAPRARTPPSSVRSAPNRRRAAAAAAAPARSSAARAHRARRRRAAGRADALDGRAGDPPHRRCRS